MANRHENYSVKRCRVINILPYHYQLSLPCTACFVWCGKMVAGPTDISLIRVACPAGACPDNLMLTLEAFVRERLSHVSTIGMQILPTKSYHELGDCDCELEIRPCRALRQMTNRRCGCDERFSTAPFYVKINLGQSTAAIRLRLDQTASH